MSGSLHIRIAIVDDHPMVRRGVGMTLAEADDFEVVGEGANFEEAVAIARKLSPDLMLLDVTMPGGGIEAVEAIALCNPNIRIAMLTICDDLATVRRALKAGASGFVSKGVDGDELLSCLRGIARGSRYVTPELAARLLQTEPVEAFETQTGYTSTPLAFTKREQELHKLLGEGLSNSEIAARLGLAETTVKQYVSHLLQKLGVRNRTAAALLSRRT